MQRTCNFLDFSLALKTNYESHDYGNYVFDLVEMMLLCTVTNMMTKIFWEHYGWGFLACFYWSERKNDVQIQWI